MSIVNHTNPAATDGQWAEYFRLVRQRWPPRGGSQQQLKKKPFELAFLRFRWRWATATTTAVGLFLGPSCKWPRRGRRTAPAIPPWSQHRPCFYSFLNGDRGYGSGPTPESTRKPPVHTRSTSRARSFDLEVTRWAPTRLTSCISHPGPAEAYEPLRSTLCPARAPFHHLAAPESTRKPLLHTRGISRARSFDLEVTPWAPTRLTSCISHSGPEEASGASTLEPGPAQHFRHVRFPPSRPAGSREWLRLRPTTVAPLVAYPPPGRATLRGAALR